jgi:DNA-binding MarR family transcriptional regulator
VKLIMTNDTTAAARELLHVIMLVMRSVSAEMRRSNPPMAPAQLGTLMRVAGGPCTMGDLSRHHAVSLPTMSKSVNMLVRRGLVARRVSESDRRETMVRLTPLGRRTMQTMRRRAERHVAAALAPLRATERAALLAALGAVKRVLGPATRTPPHGGRCP